MVWEPGLIASVLVQSITLVVSTRSRGPAMFGDRMMGSWILATKMGAKTPSVFCCMRLHLPDATVVAAGTWHAKAHGLDEGDMEVLHKARELCAEGRGRQDSAEPANSDGV